MTFIFVYYETIKRELKIRGIEIYGSPIHWVGLGTGTPKDRDEVNKLVVISERFAVLVREGSLSTVCFFCPFPNSPQALERRVKTK